MDAEFWAQAGEIAQQTKPMMNFFIRLSGFINKNTDKVGFLGWRFGK